jgi:hypothetical protein
MKKVLVVSISILALLVLAGCGKTLTSGGSGDYGNVPVIEKTLPVEATATDVTAAFDNGADVVRISNTLNISESLAIPAGKTLLVSNGGTLNVTTTDLDISGAIVVESGAVLQMNVGNEPAIALQSLNNAIKESGSIKFVSGARLFGASELNTFIGTSGDEGYAAWLADNSTLTISKINEKHHLHLSGTLHIEDETIITLGIAIFVQENSTDVRDFISADPGATVVLGSNITAQNNALKGKTFELLPPDEEVGSYYGLKDITAE